jgi:hypothetical protein
MWRVSRREAILQNAENSAETQRLRHPNSCSRIGLTSRTGLLATSAPIFSYTAFRTSERSNSTRQHHHRQLAGHRIKDGRHLAPSACQGLARSPWQALIGTAGGQCREPRHALSSAEAVPLPLRRPLATPICARRSRATSQYCRSNSMPR